MNAVAAHRAQKSIRLSLPATRLSVRVANLGGFGHLPVVGRSTHLGSFSVSLLTPFAVWPLAVALGGNWLAAGLLVAALATAWGTAALIDIDQHGTPADHDSRAVVIDELAGAALACTALALLPSLPTYKVFFYLVLTGLIFRLIDIAKPYPINRLDTAWHHPFSVMADDLLAGVYTCLLVGGFIAAKLYFIV
jgi:phosphatidylglycerophosphatase A